MEASVDDLLRIIGEQTVQIWLLKHERVSVPADESVAVPDAMPGTRSMPAELHSVPAEKQAQMRQAAQE